MPPKRRAAAAAAGSPPAAMTTTTTRATKRRTAGDKSGTPAAKKRATTARSTTSRTTAAYDRPHALVPIGTRSAVPLGAINVRARELTWFSAPCLVWRPLVSAWIVRDQAAASCRAWFDSYADPDDPETIGPDGIERLCNDLGMDPASFPILVLAFTLNAAELGTFTATEWTVAMTKHQLHTTAQLKAFLNHNAARIQADRSLFRDCYKYAFELMRQPPARAVPLDMATDMWPLVLGHQAQWARVTADWIAFLSEEGRGVKVITRDQWTSWLDFVSQTTPPFDQYDADGSAWCIISAIGGPALATICRLFAEDYYHNAAGMPDLCLWTKTANSRPADGGADAVDADQEYKVVFAEVKGPHDTLSDKQRVWIDALLAAGIDVHLCLVKLHPGDPAAAAADAEEDDAELIDDVAEATSATSGSRTSRAGRSGRGRAASSASRRDGWPRAGRPSVADTEAPLSKRARKR
ncbi:Scaffold-type E3 ligase [Allomyces arbusculus]|nr:Scaffold-type E3 ligase [Allomyces arbusculus]